MYKKAFTIVEIIVAITVLTVGVLGVATFFANSSTLSRAANHISTASNLAQGIIDEQLTKSYGELVAGTGTKVRVSEEQSSPYYQYYKQVDIILIDSNLAASGSDIGLKQIIVKVFYQEGEVEKNIEMSTIKVRSATPAPPPPPPPPPCAGYTKSLLHFDGDNGSTVFSDECKTWTANAAGPQLTTASKKFGTASLTNNSTANYVRSDANADFNTGTGDFTIEAWFNKGGGSSGPHKIFQKYENASNYYVFSVQRGGCMLPPDGQLVFKAVVGGVTKANYTSDCLSDFGNGTWRHLAVARSGSNLYMFIDGTSRTLTVNTAIITNSIDNNGEERILETDTIYGYLLDEFRFSKGIARWTANFTPPTAAYPDTN